MVLPKAGGVLALSELALGPSGLMIPASNLGLDLADHLLLLLGSNS